MFENILFLIVLFFANVIQTITGFAGTLLALPFSIKIVGIEEAKVVLNIFILIGSLIIAIQNFKLIDFKISIKILIFMFIGIILGIKIYSILPLSFLLKILGIIIIGVELDKIWGKKEKNLQEWVLNIVLLFAGIIHGMFLSGGSLLVVYAVQKIKDKGVFRATISAIWVVLQSVMVISYFISGYLTKERIILAGTSIIPLVLSIIVGNLLYDKIKQEQFEKLTYLLLAISGISMFV